MNLGESSNSLPVSSNTIIIKPEYQGDLTKQYGSRSIRMHIESYLGYFKPSESNFTFDITMSGRGNPQPSADAAIHSLFNRCHTRDGTNTHLLEEVLQYNALCAQTMQYSRTEASVNDRSMYQGLSESKAADGSLYWALAGGSLWTDSEMREPSVARNVQICTPIKTKLYSTGDYIPLEAFGGLRLEFLLDDYRRSLEYQTGSLAIEKAGSIPGYPVTIFDGFELPADGAEDAQPQFNYLAGVAGVGYEAGKTYSLSSSAGVIGWLSVIGVSAIGGGGSPLIVPGNLFPQITQQVVGAANAAYPAVATTVAPAGGAGATLNITVAGGVVTVATCAVAGAGYSVGDVLTVANGLIGGGGTDLEITLIAGDLGPGVPGTGGAIKQAEIYCLGSTSDAAPVPLPRPGDVLTVGLPSGVAIGNTKQEISFLPLSNVSGSGAVASAYTEIEVPLWNGTSKKLIEKFTGASIISAYNFFPHIVGTNPTGAANGVYANVATTSNGNGQGALLNVTVAGGTVTVVTAVAGGSGSGYFLGERLTVASGLIGSGSNDLVVKVEPGSLSYQSTWLASPTNLPTHFGSDTVKDPTRDVARAASAASGSGLCFPGAVIPIQVADRLYMSTCPGADEVAVGVVSGIELYLDDMPRLLVRPDRVLQPSPANDALLVPANVVAAAKVWSRAYSYHNKKDGFQLYVKDSERLNGYTYNENAQTSNALPASVNAAASSAVDFLIKDFEYQLKRVEVDPKIAAADNAACNTEKGMDIDLETTACRLVNQASLVGPAQMLVSIPNVTAATGVLSVPIPQGTSALNKHNLRGEADNLESYQYEIGGKLCPNREVNVSKASLPNPLHGAWESMEKIKCLESFGVSCTNLNRIPSFSVGRSFARPGMTFNLMRAGDLQLKTQYDAPQTSAKLFVHYLNHIRMINCNKNGMRISN